MRVAKTASRAVIAGFKLPCAMKDLRKNYDSVHLGWVGRHSMQGEKRADPFLKNRPELSGFFTTLRPILFENRQLINFNKILILAWKLRHQDSGATGYIPIFSAHTVFFVHESTCVMLNFKTVAVAIAVAGALLAT